MVDRLVPVFEDAGVRLVLSGHEHNFQHSVVNGIHYVITGAGGKLREDRPTGLDAAGAREWAAVGHFLILEADDRRVLIHPVCGAREDGELELVERVDPGGVRLQGPLEIPLRC